MEGLQLQPSQQMAAGAVQCAVMAGAEALRWSEMHFLCCICQCRAAADACHRVHLHLLFGNQVCCCSSTQIGREAIALRCGTDVDADVLRCTGGEGE